MGFFKRSAARVGIAAAMAVSIVGAGVAASVPASAAPSCSSGYVCLFNRTNGSDGIRIAYQYGIANYANKTFHNSSVNLDNNVDAVFYNWQNSRISFWTGANYSGAQITTYKPGEQGFRNWSAANRNIASSHKDLGK